MKRAYPFMPAKNRVSGLLNNLLFFINNKIEKLAIGLLTLQSWIRARRPLQVRHQRGFQAANGGRRRGLWRPTMYRRTLRGWTPFLSPLA